ncbi:hypothetical protein [Saccharopolyspora sp. NPDC002686]|uniref:hypothetical protein n=1 Tax=Saccharopolyspora sp. NPDC002686 TaxID=3154541 RepID=UPI003329553A
MEDQDLVNAYDEQLRALKASPEFDQILAKWGFSADASRKVTRDQLCSVAG